MPKDNRKNGGQSGPGVPGPNKLTPKDSTASIPGSRGRDGQDAETGNRNTKSR